MARYYPVSPLFWSDEKVARWDSETRLLALYLLTCEHRNLEGLYRLPYAYIQADLEWSEVEVRDRMRTLLDSGFIKYDEAARVVLLPKALKYHTCGSDKQIQGAINALQEVPDSTLWPDFLASAQTFSPKLFDRLGGPNLTLSEPVANGFISDEVAAK